MNLASEAAAIETRTATSPWRDHEHVRGYAGLELPFSSGHLLGLRVWPQTDFAPWVSVWHRTPEGEWSMFNDGLSLETTCPHYWKPVLRRAELASIDVTWTGPNELRVEMEEPRLAWTMSMRASPLLRGLKAVSTALPFWSWRLGPLLRVREWIAKRLLGMGDVRLSFTSPTGHEAAIMPEEIFFVDAAEAVLDGRALAEPARLETNPTIGDVPTPARPIFTLGQAPMRITDLEEYHRTRERVRDGSPDSTTSKRETRSNHG